MTRLARNVPIVVALFVTVGCGGDERPGRTLIAFTKVARQKPAEIWVATANGTAPRRLLRGAAPAVSPDGRWITFHRCGEVDCDLYLVDTGGGRPRLLARRAEWPTWSPRSDRIVARRTVGSQGYALVSVDAGSSREVELARGSLWGWSVSPSGAEVVYGRGEAASGDYFGRERIDLYVVGSEGGEPRRLTRDGRSGFPVWGPDVIAFARLLPYRGWGRHEIWRIEPDGSGRRTVTGRLPRRLVGSGITGLVPVGWSEHGDALLAELTNEFGGPPYAVDPATGAIRKIGDFGYYAISAGLSRDGRFVLVVEGGLPEAGAREGLVIAPYRGGPAKLIATRAGEASWNR